MGFSIGKVFNLVENEMKKYAEVDSIYLPVSNYSLKGLWKNIKYAQSCCKKKKYDIVHITGTEHYLIPFLNKQKIVVTVHDLGSITVKKSFKNFVKNILFIKTLKYAELITCVSDKTRDEILSVVNNSFEKIITISNPVDPTFQYTEHRFNDNTPIILHIGTKSNKNLENTVKALVGMKCQLRIIGVLSSMQKDILLHSKIFYSNAVGLTDDELLEEYKKSDIINFPSYYEGFGMPIIEGQAIGRLVITSNIEPMLSVAGDGAIFCNPYDVNSIRNAYLKGINDSNYRDKIILKGKENIKKHLLKNITEKYYNLYMTL